jgi:hypothetical protein
MLRFVIGCFSIVVLAAMGCAKNRTVTPQPSQNNGHGNPDPIMTVAELEPILRKAQASGKTVPVYGYSVFEGHRIERFEAEIIDIMANFLPKRHLVLAKLKGNHPVIAKAGVIAGMSGSPMYVDGKMLGALAYSMGRFGKEPIIGITPVEYMIEDAKRAAPEIAAPPLRTSETGLSPVETPIMVSGMSGRTIEKLSAELKKYNMVAVPSGSGSPIHDVPDTFVPGSAIGALLVSGDMDMTGIGTVTFVDGDLIVGFGHPFFGTGQVDMPISTAVIHTVFPGMSLSFKIGSPAKIVGQLTQDRSTCIAGRYGKSSRMIPVNVNFSNIDEKLSHVMRVQIVDNPGWFPFLLMSVMSNGLDTFDPTEKPRTTLTRLEVKLSDGRILKFEELEASHPQAGSLYSGGSGNVVGNLLQILRNTYSKVEIQSVDVTHEFISEARVSVIKEAWLLTPEVPEQGTAKIRMRLGRWRAADEFLEVEVPLPKDATKGTEIAIEIAGGAQVDPLRPPASTLDELIASMQKEFKSTQLVASVNVGTYTFLYKGKTLDRMPNSMTAQLIPGLMERGIVAMTPVRTVTDVGQVVKGTAQVTVKVK